MRQHIAPLRRHGIEVTEETPAISKYARLPGWPRSLAQSWAAPLYALWLAAKLATRLPGVVSSWRHDVTWLQRDLLPGIPTLEPVLGRPLVFDVDDAVWLKQPWGAAVARRVAGRASRVIAGNRHIAEWFTRGGANVSVVPTAIDTGRFRPREEEDTTEEFTIGWTGLASNFCHLRAVERPLLEFLAEHPDTNLLIVADRAPEGALAPSEQVHFQPWSEDLEAETVRKMDVGLMPLPDTPWARGKCGFKLLQYMACGVPIIASPVGMNCEILELGSFGAAATSAQEWYAALGAFRSDRPQARAAGREGREVVERHFSRSLIADRLATILQQVGDR